VGLNKVGLAAEAFYIGDVFNVGFVNVWGFEKVGPVAPSYSAGVSRGFGGFSEHLSFKGAMMSWII
jgi:hypothetical protein